MPLNKFATKLIAWPLYVCVMFAAACSPQRGLYSQTAYVFGTQVDISIWGIPDTLARKYIGLIFQEFDRMHHRLHAWKKSDITALNQGFALGLAMPIDRQMHLWLRQAQSYAIHSNHLFNPAIGQLIAAWGFHQDTPAAQIPPSPVIQNKLKSQPSLSDLIFTANTVRSANSAVALDLGGIAKGWALDYAIAYLRRNQVTDALVNVGGNIRVLGTKGKTPWIIALQDPRAPEPMATIMLNNGEAIGTSGDYQHYFIFDGIRYNHLIDPRLGKPAQRVRSATVIAPDSAQAGALSEVVTKPLFMEGVALASTYLARFALKDALIIDNQGHIYLTAAMQARIKWLRTPPDVHYLK